VSLRSREVLATASRIRPATALDVDANNNTVPKEGPVAPEEKRPVECEVAPEEKMPMEGEVASERETAPVPPAPPRVLQRLACSRCGFDDVGVGRHGRSTGGADNGRGDDGNEDSTDHYKPPAARAQQRFQRAPEIAIDDQIRTLK
jgi:hypothetical protein